MIAAISEWSWMICVLLLRTAAITTVILLATALAVRWYRGASAAIRHRLWLTAVLGCLATPVVLAFVPSRLISVTPAAAAISVEEPNLAPAPKPVAPAGLERKDNFISAMPPPYVDVDEPDLDARDFAAVRHDDQWNSQFVPAAPIGATPSPSVEPLRVVSTGNQLAAFATSFSASRFPRFVVAVWMLVAAVLLVRLLIAMAATQRLIRRCDNCTNSEAFSLLAERCEAMHIRRPVGLLLSSEIDVPTLAGVRRPLILLPREATTWSRDRLSMVLRHELAHVARRDLLSQLLADVVAAIGWFQPFLWHAARRLRIERELACDDLVLQTGTIPCDYAEELLSVAATAVSPRRPSLVTVTMAGPSTVEQRIRSILDPQVKRQPVSRKGTACVIAVAAAVLIGASYSIPTLAINSPPALATETPRVEDEAPDARLPNIPTVEATVAVVETEKKNANSKPMDEFSGQVVDENGKPAPDVEVRLLNVRLIDTKERPITTTDADGKFRLSVPRLPRSYQTLEARADNSRRIGVYGIHFEKPNTKLTDLKLTIEPAREVTIRVIDGDGKPIKGAQAGIVAYMEDDSMEQSDERGIATLFIPRASVIQQAYAFKGGVGFDYKSFVDRSGARNKQNDKKPEFPAEGVTLTLNGVQPLAVKVLTPDGKPIPDVSVYPWLLTKPGESSDLNFSFLDHDRLGDLRTDENGIANISWMPHWQKQPLMMWPDSLKFKFDVAIFDPLTGDGLFEMRLAPLVPVRGKVVMPDGTAGVGIDIDVAGDDFSDIPFNRTVTTNEDGTFEVLAAPNMVYLLVVSNHQWAAKPITGFGVWQNQPIENLHFQLRPATRIHGRITTGTDNKPLARYEVVCNQQGEEAGDFLALLLRRPEQNNECRPTVAFRTMTDDEGRYEFFVGPGNFYLRDPNRNYDGPFQMKGDIPFEIKDETEKVLDLHVMEVAQEAKQTGTDRSNERSKHGTKDDVKTGQNDKKNQTSHPMVELSGHVIDENGEPVAGVEVELKTYKDEQPTATTDAEGHFSMIIEQMSWRFRVLTAVADDRRRLGVLRLLDEAPESGLTNLKITIDEAREVTLRVVDGDGKPVANAHAGVITDFDDAGATLSDENGIAIARIATAETIQHAYAMKDHAGFDYKSFVIPRDLRNDKNAMKPDFPADGMTLTLDGAQPLEVKVLTAQGEPIPDVRVYPFLFFKEGEADYLNVPYIMSVSREKYTDVNGIAKLGWIPQWQKQSITVFARSEGYSQPRGEYDPATGDGTLKIRLDRLVPIRGKVVFPDGRDAGGIQIEATGADYGSDGFRQSFTTHADGTFEARVAPNMIYLLIVKDEKWGAEPLTGFAVWPNQPIDDLKFELRPTTRIHGRVTVGPDRKPVPNVNIYSQLYGADAQDLEGVKLPNPENSRRYVQPVASYHAMTDEEGRYEFFVGPGYFNIRQNQSKAEEFEITNETEMKFDFHMPRAERGILKGRVVAGDPPKPVAGAKVAGIVRSELLSGDFNAVTDENGQFEVERKLNPGVIHAYSADGRLGSLLAIEADTTQIEISLQPVADAKAILVDSTTGKPLAGREIYYSTDKYTMRFSIGEFRTAWGETKKTDDEGRFTMEGLVLDGTYYISVDLGGGRGSQIGSVTPTEPGTIDLGKLELESPGR